jgi:hypothetical protein
MPNLHILIGESNGKRALGRLKERYEGIIKVDLRVMSGNL